MSETLLKDTRFRSEIVSFFKKNTKEVLDIILFGSSVRGKEKPGDIDLLMLFKDSKNIDLSYSLKQKLKARGYVVEITDITYPELLGGLFRAVEGLLAEGYSIAYNKPLAESLGYNSLVLFKYDLKGFNKSQRMRFYYSLYGRGTDGLLKELGAIKFSDTVLLCGAASSERMKDYLENWKINFVHFPILIPSRLKHFWLPGK